ncbi:MAG: cation:proton antiporter [Wenzhouxiangella sp.]
MQDFDSAFTIILAATCAFLALVSVLRHYAPKSPLPAESWLLLAGIGYGLLSPMAAVLPAAEPTPELILGLILPVLIFSAGRNLDVGMLLRDAAPISVMVLFGIPLTIIVIGLPVAWLLDIPFTHGLLFGTAVAATDKTSVARVLARFSIPNRLTGLLQGESIFNDAFTIVIFTSLAGVVVAQEAFSALQIGVESIRSILLAVPVGLLLGWLAGRLVRHWGEQNRMPGLTLTLALAVVTFLLSELMLHASGIIAVLCAALAFSHTRQSPEVGEDPGHHQLYNELWDYLGSLGGSVLYFSLGALIATQLLGLHLLLALAPLLLLISRAALIYGTGPLLRLDGQSVPLAWRHVLMLAGLRGAVPAALVLMMPADYPYRDALLLMVFTLVAYSLVVHPLLIQWYLHGHSVDSISDEDGKKPADGSRRHNLLSGALQRKLDGSGWGPAALAGLFAGTLFLGLEMTLVAVAQDISPWVPVRMIAAIGLGPDVLPPPAEFALNVALTAVVVHFTLSLVYAWILAPLIEGVTTSKGLLVGLAFGAAVYLVNFHLFTVMFPWFADARSWTSVLSHLVFGLVLAGSYLGLRRHLKQ